MDVVRGVQFAVVLAAVAGIGVGGAMLSRPSTEAVVPIELAVDERSEADEPPTTPPASATERTDDGDSIVTPDVREDVPPPAAERDEQPRTDGSPGQTARPSGGGADDDEGDDGGDGGGDGEDDNDETDDGDEGDESDETDDTDDDGDDETDDGDDDENDD